MSIASAQDPVCGMSVAIAPDALRAEHGGEIYYFCSASCRQKFLDEPQKYLAPAADPGDKTGT